MRTAKLLLLVLTVLVSVFPCALTCVAQAPPTIEAELNRYGVPTTQLGLRSALKDERPEVRDLAASELGSMKDTASVPLIVKAFEDEKDSKAKFDMASALVLLNSQTGRRALLHVCDDTSLPVERRLDAASRLVDAGDSKCLSSVENILKNATSPANKVSALLVLARVKAISASLVPGIHNTLLVSLRDPDSAVRQYAGQCIAALADKAAAPDLRTAIASESDQLTRQRMAESLEILESKP